MENSVNHPQSPESSGNIRDVLEEFLPSDIKNSHDPRWPEKMLMTCSPHCSSFPSDTGYACQQREQHAETFGALQRPTDVAPIISYTSACTLPGCPTPGRLLPSSQPSAVAKVSVYALPGSGAARVSYISARHGGGATARVDFGSPVFLELWGHSGRTRLLRQRRSQEYNLAASSERRGGHNRAQKNSR
ncbi:unnamed protein product [Menidia menidia]|uniref:(Atlantic silverside) hypothetical protein n=1 Tax=Menidia menidia TaxID=238744 RepID=A0A8S4BIN9_9TELE|nr:unnamed protein product [Menidia menidia]